MDPDWRCIPPKINIEPENDGLEDDFPFPEVYSQVPCYSSAVYFLLKMGDIPASYVSFPEGKSP